jgi:DNA topoisomerase VI subunit A
MWLGVRKAWVDDHCNVDAMQDLSSADLSKLANLIEVDERLPLSWKWELHEMEKAGMKCEIETVYKSMGIEKFCKFIVEHMAMYIAL